jgi:hypothetical protein
LRVQNQSILAPVDAIATFRRALRRLSSISATITRALKGAALKGAETLKGAGGIKNQPDVLPSCFQGQLLAASHWQLVIK